MSDFVGRLVAWQEQAGRHDLPWQQSRDPYRVWLSEIMLQQTQVNTVIGYYERFLERFPTVQSLGQAEQAEVMPYWAGLGYYARARNLHRCAQIICQEHAGEFPQDPEVLQSLPGIGKSTANAIAAFCFNAPTPIMDGNVKRVFTRFYGISGTGRATEKQLWQQAYVNAQEHIVAQEHARAQQRLNGRTSSAEEIGAEVEPGAEVVAVDGAAAAAGDGSGTGLEARVEAGVETSDGSAAASDGLGLGQYNQALMDLGSTVCKRSKPLCATCPLQRDCYAHQHNLQAELPTRKVKKAVPVRECSLLVLQQGQEIFLQRRPEQGIWGGLLSLPEFSSDEQMQQVIDEQGLSAGQNMAAFEHVFSHYRLIIQPHYIVLNTGLSSANGLGGLGGAGDLESLGGTGGSRGTDGAKTGSAYKSNIHEPSHSYAQSAFSLEGAWYDLSKLEELALPAPILKILSGLVAV